MDKGEIRQIIVDLTRARGPDKSICPSEAAKAINPDEQIWRSYLKTIRRTAIDMAQNEEIHITRKGKIQNPHEDIKGVIRLKMRD